MRREFSRSPIVQQMMRENKRYVPKYKKDGTRARIDMVMHKCAACNEWKSGKFAIDHIEPVVDPDVGFVDFNTYFKRMFVGREKLQKLCASCHRLKTNTEIAQRSLKEHRETLDLLEKSDDIKYIKKELKKFTKKRLEKCAEEIIIRINAIKNKLK